MTTVSREQSSFEVKLQALVDKDAIREVIYRYCRAVDRCDRELMKSCYWPDASDNHAFYSGNAHTFVDYVIPILEQARSTTHSISNVLLELDGDRACGESYVHVTHTATVTRRTCASAPANSTSRITRCRTSGKRCSASVDRG